MMQIPTRTLALPFAAALLAAGPALAQQTTTATYDDWTLRCVNEAGPPPKKTCELEQVARMQGQNNPISRVAVAPPAGAEPLRIVVQVPINVAVTAPVKIDLGDKGAELSAPFLRCMPGGCFAVVAIDAAMVKRWRASTAAGKITYKNAANQDVAIPLSPKGFGAAFDALTK